MHCLASSFTRKALTVVPLLYFSSMTLLPFNADSWSCVVLCLLASHSKARTMTSFMLDILAWPLNSCNDTLSGSAFLESWNNHRFIPRHLKIIGHSCIFKGYQGTIFNFVIIFLKCFSFHVATLDTKHIAEHPLSDCLFWKQEFEMDVEMLALHLSLSNVKLRVHL